MLDLKLGGNENAPKEFLFLGAHCDDIEIGCGGTVLRLARDFPQAKVHWVVFSSNEKRAAEARRSSELFLSSVKNKIVIIKDFRNGYFPYVGAQIKDYFEELKRTVKPDVIFTHHGLDNHQDHRVLSELTWNTFRDHFILEYEIPKYDGGLGSPNIFFPLQQMEYQKKLDILLECFATEHAKHWFTRETFMGLLRLRGIECGAPSGYAEAFYSRKAIL
ncbi:MAG: PIG-L deacetylase family protein [Sulfuricaulis sp.]